MSSEALAGIRVVDLTRNFAGPFCTMTLGDLGAEVVKIEQPGTGDDTRQWAPPTWGEVSANFLSCNRNKRSLAVDLNRPEGAELVRDLARRADVLVESFKPGSLDRRGLGWDQLRAENPRLLYCSISAYGQEGAKRDSPGYDPILQAYTGIMHITGWPDGPPARLGVGALDLGAALWATIAIQAGLTERERTGAGMRIDTSLLESAAYLLSYHLGGYLGSGHDLGRGGTSAGFLAPYETFPTADGELMVAAANDNLFRTFVALIELPELADDPRFLRNAERVRNRVALRDTLVVRLATKTAEEWERILLPAVPCTRVRTVADFANDEQLATIDLLKALPTPAVPDLRVVDLPFRRDGRRAGQWLPPPELGEHTDEILTELGLDPDRVATLRADGTVA